MLCTKLTEAQELHGPVSTTGLQASPEFNAELSCYQDNKLSTMMPLL